MQITLANSGKRYNRDWIFKGINFTFSPKKAYAITGSNGSGKSTLLQSISGLLELNEGKMSWKNIETNTEIASEDVYKHLSVVAPYLELVEEMSAKEFLKFHASFKPLIAGFSFEQILSLVELPTSSFDKQIRFFSSGMKQRVKLAQAIFSNVPLLLLDEPCTNLDKSGYNLYHRLINRFCTEKLIIVSSNDEAEYSFCTEKISIQDYKNSSTILPSVQ